MEKQYLKKILEFAKGMKLSCEHPIEKLTKDVEKFENALSLLASVGINAGTVKGENYVFKAGVKPVRTAVTPQEAVALVQCGALEQCEMKKGAYLVFPYSLSVMKVEKVAKGFTNFSRMVDGQTEEVKISNKLDAYCIDINLILD